MSIHLVVEVWKSNLDRNCKSIALIYADAASDDGNGIYFSLEHAAWKSGYDERSVRRISQTLEEIGVLQFLGRSESKTKRYRFIEDKLPQRPSWKEYREQRKNIVDKMSATSRTKCPVEVDKMSDNPTSDPTYSNLLISEEDSFFQKEGELENPSIATPPDSVSTVKVSGSDVVKVNLAGALHNVAVAEDPALVFAHQFPDVEQDIAVILPPNATYPVKVKVKKAANSKAAPPPKPKKEPKPPRELDPREAEFLAQVEQLDPFMGKQVESRLRKYRRDKPWSALQVYLLTGKPVPPASLQAVTSLNGTAFNTELMLKCLSAWVSKGWSPYNLNWLLDWYKAGGPPQYVKYGQQQQAVQVAPTPASKPKIEFDDPLVIDSTQWVMNTPGYGSKSPNSIRLGMWMAANNDEMYAFHFTDAPELLAKYLAEKSI